MTHSFVGKLRSVLYCSLYVGAWERPIYYTVVSTLQRHSNVTAVGGWGLRARWKLLHIIDHDHR